MRITYANYQSILPESLWEKFISMAHTAARRMINIEIIYRQGNLFFNYD